MGSSPQLTKAKSRSRTSSLPTTPQHTPDEASHGLQRVEESEGGGRDCVPTISVPLSPALPERQSISRQSILMDIPPCMFQSDPASIDALVFAVDTPPCTIKTLRELDLVSIEHNLNLRADLCYDHDLYFQPVTGRKGEVKRQETNKYRLALAAEYQIHEHNAQPDCASCASAPNRPYKAFAPRLRSMFVNLKGIVNMLIPEMEHVEVTNRLDVDLLMQQISHAVLDALQLAEWLAALLTSHCAPMRDRCAVEIVDCVRAGTADSDILLIMSGIEKLFGLLESMKLDVANHQIREFRQLLIDDTVSFQRAYFSQAIKSGCMNVSKSREWYCDAFQQHKKHCRRQSSQPRAAHPLEASLSVSHLKPPSMHRYATVPQQTQRALGFHALLHGLVQLCRPTVGKVPLTLQYDFHRFVRLQEDLQDLVQIELCLRVFERRAREILHGRSFQNPAAVHDELKSRIIFLTEDENGNGGAISDHLEEISFELTRTAYSLLVDRHTSGPDKVVSPPISHDECTKTKDALRSAFGLEDRHLQLTYHFMEMLEDRSREYGDKFLALSALEISTEQRDWSHKRARVQSGGKFILTDCDDMARRLAHIGVMHWRVWADLCYRTESHMFATANPAMAMPSSRDGEFENQFDDHCTHGPFPLACTAPRNPKDQSGQADLR